MSTMEDHFFSAGYVLIRAGNHDCTRFGMNC